MWSRFSSKRPASQFFSSIVAPSHSDEGNAPNVTAPATCHIFSMRSVTVATKQIQLPRRLSHYAIENEQSGDDHYGRDEGLALTVISRGEERSTKVHAWSCRTSCQPDQRLQRLRGHACPPDPASRRNGRASFRRSCVA